LKSTGIGDTVYIGPEAEFFIFDDIRFESTRFGAFYEIDSIEGNWNTGRDEGPNLGYKPRHKEGYFPVPPMDKFQDLRTEMVLTLEELGIETEAQHHEVATAGQSEIDMRFKPLLQMADQLMWFKYVLKNVAYRHNHTVTFMPKPFLKTTAPACTPMSASGKRGSHCLPVTSTPGFPRRPVCHRRYPETLPGPMCLYQPHHQLLQKTGAGV
jgi:glutamine synthetase